jgi:hypothetical protein
MPRAVRAALDELVAATDDELEARYREARRSAGFPRFIGEPLSPHDACLLEMVRRGGARWEGFLKGELERSREAVDHYGLPVDLELVTALRRVQGERDSLCVSVVDGPRFEALFPELPVLHVRLEHAGVYGARFAVTDGGDYRGGRLARFAVAMRDDDGRPEPMLAGECWGGAFTRTLFEPGSTLEGLLPLRHYAVPRAGGEHRFWVRYHNQVTIADVPGTSTSCLPRRRS